jgi:uncharacterized protein
MRRTISVPGSASLAGTPDVADVRLGVGLTRLTVAEARAGAAATMTAVLEAIRDAGVEAADIRTSNLSLTPQYRYEQDRDPILSAYLVTNQVTVTVRDLGRLGRVVDDALEAGATSLDGLAFRIAEPGPLQVAARQAAVADARARAEVLATAAGAVITGVVSISELDSGSIAPFPVVARFRAAAASAPTPIEAGSSEVSVSVSVVYSIGDTA